MTAYNRDIRNSNARQIAYQNEQKDAKYCAQNPTYCAMRNVKMPSFRRGGYEEFKKINRKTKTSKTKTSKTKTSKTKTSKTRTSRSRTKNNNIMRLL